MASLLTPLNLYASFPVQDSYNDGNITGIIRFMDAADSLTLGVFQRVQGDFMKRSQLLEAGINSVIALINANPFITGLDDAPYIRIDGTRDFTAAVKGVTPTDAAHLVTKQYADTGDANATAAANSVGTALAAYKGVNPYTFKSGWQSYTWAGGVRTVVNLTLLQTLGLLPVPDSVTSIRILEKLDISQPTMDNPTPTPVFVYRDLTATSKSFALEDFWYIAASATVRVLVPNVSGYDSGYTGSDYDKLQTPRARWLQAVVTAGGAAP